MAPVASSRLLASSASDFCGPAGATRSGRSPRTSLGPYVAEVQKSCETAVAENRSVMIDVAGLSYVDRDGLALIRHLMAVGVQFANCSLFLAEQLKEVSS